MNEILALTQEGFTISFKPDYDVKQDHVRITLEKNHYYSYNTVRFPLTPPMSLDLILSALVLKWNTLYG